MNTSTGATVAGMLSLVLLTIVCPVHAGTIPITPLALLGQEAGGAVEPDARAQWNAREAQLLEAIAEAVKTCSESNKTPERDWKAIEGRVQDMFYAEAGSATESNWPETQTAWVRAVQKKLTREEKQQAGSFEQDMEKEVVYLVSVKLEEAGKPAEEEAQVDETGEPVWKFRDKSGARTTKPRYKGQEPLN